MAMNVSELQKLRFDANVVTADQVGEVLPTHYEVVRASSETDAQAITRILNGATPKQGDVCVVKALIATGDTKYSYTAYVYDSSAWKAMDGNYNADNVYFGEDLTFTANIGVKTVPASGSATIAASGKSLSQVMKSILAQEKYPTVTQPTASLQLKNGSSNVSSISVENGTTVTPGFSYSFTKGSYTYGPDTGVAVSSIAGVLKKGSTEVETLTDAGSFTAIKVNKNETYTVGLTVNHTQGAVPVTNLGSDATTDIADCEGSKVSRIAAGSISKTSGNISGYIMGRFYGTLTSVVATGSLTSAQVRGLTKNNASTTTGTFTLNVPVGAKTIVIAVAGTRTLSKVLNTTVNADMTTSFTPNKGTMTVAGADGDVSSDNASTYTVWTYSPAEAYASPASLSITIA